MSVETEIVREATPDVMEAFARLLPQLSSRAEPLDRDAVEELVRTGTNTLLVARVDGVIVGTLTLVMSPLLSGLRAHIEDVVVDAGARGHGVGGALIDTARHLRREPGPSTSPRGRRGRPRTACTNGRDSGGGNRPSTASPWTEKSDGRGGEARVRHGREAWRTGGAREAEGRPREPLAVALDTVAP